MSEFLHTPEHIERYIPYDKSWMIRMGLLDMVHGYDDINRLLDDEQHLGTDLQALNRATKQWREGDEIVWGSRVRCTAFCNLRPGKRAGTFIL